MTVSPVQEGLWEIWKENHKKGRKALNKYYWDLRLGGPVDEVIAFHLYCSVYWLIMQAMVAYYSLKAWRRARMDRREILETIELWSEAQ